MQQLLGLLLISFAITSFFMVPFIDFLFFLKRKFEKKETSGRVSSETPIHNQLMKDDETTPSGGGILLILVLAVMSVAYALLIPLRDWTDLKILLFTLFSFGSLGLVDDIRWLTTKRRGKLLGLGRRILILIQILFALMIAYMLYSLIGLNNLNIPLVNNFNLGWLYVPFAAFVIVSFSNAYNISDGLDGLSTGLLTICLFAFLALASASLNLTLAAFIGIWIGALFAYLYFNVYPARIFLGDAGAFGFGAALAVVGLLSGKIIGLGVIGAVYIIIVATSLLQILSKKIFKKKLFPVAPFPIYLKYIVWEKPKIFP